MSNAIISYKASFIDGHVFIEIPQTNKNLLRALIDTGSSTTLSSSHKILNLCGSEFNTSQSELFGASTHNLEDLIGQKIDYLIGNDVLCQFSFEIRKNKMSFYSINTAEPEMDPVNGSIECELISYPLDRLMTLPIMKVETPFKTSKMYFDTGAKLSYGSKKWFSSIPKDGSSLNGTRFLGKEDDFHPSIGKFKSEIYSMPVVITSDSLGAERGFNGSAQLNMKFGILPKRLDYMVTTFEGVEGIFGSELLEYCNSIFLTNDRMYIY
ncbi:hypothetical protein [Leptospira sp. 'Mane']|uniref:hypothetical protein n=1 Tax=Leptospira sp. 'Mane' TaxID=3387407 RepID=UPI00398AAC4B